MKKQKQVIIKQIPLRLVDFAPIQPRDEAERRKFEDLREDMAVRGQMVEIQVTPARNRYRLVDGERRTRAARDLGWRTISAKIVTFASPVNELEAQFVLNLKRVNITIERVAHWVKEFKRVYRLKNPEATDFKIARHLAKLSHYAPKFFMDADCINRTPPEMRALINGGKIGRYVAAEIESATADPDFRVGLQDAYVKQAKTGRTLGALQVRLIRRDLASIEAKADAEDWSASRKKNIVKSVLLDSAGIGHNGHHRTADYDLYMHKVNEWRNEVKHWTAVGLSDIQATEISNGLNDIFRTFHEMRRAVTGKTGDNTKHRQPRYTPPKNKRKK